MTIEMQAHGIAVNVLSPSEPVITPGNLSADAAGFGDDQDSSLPASVIQRAKPGMSKTTCP